MTPVSLCWVDWKLSVKAMLRESAVRFFLLLLLAAYFTAMLLSGGMNRFLSGQWAVTAILRLSVSAEVGKGIAGKAAGLPGVRSAAYKDPETSWKEFLAAYPGLEALRTAGGNPLPGYVEIRMLPDRFTETDIRSMETALRLLPQVESLLSGGDVLSRLLRVKRWVNGLFWAGFGLLCAVFFLVLFLQEKTRASILSVDFGFLEERGIPAARIAFSRALGAALTGELLSLAAAGATVSWFFLLEKRLALIGRVIGPAEDILALPFLLPLGLFLLAAPLLHGGASLLGWRAAHAVRK
ncbi:MAG: permease-like cell division protein FtsX [Candidatus Deferrimicrobiota bacterium]